MVDKDGHFTYSGVKNVSKDCAGLSVTVHPNPATSRLYIKGLQPGDYIEWMDAAGRRIFYRKTTGAGTEQLAIGQYSAGSYLLKVISANGSSSVTRVVKQ